MLALGLRFFGGGGGGGGNFGQDFGFKGGIWISCNTKKSPFPNPFSQNVQDFSTRDFKLCGIVEKVQESRNPAA